MRINNESAKLNSMPSVTISTSKLQSLLASKVSDDYVSVLTPLGNTILEIQGDLDVPKTPPADDPDQRFFQQDGVDVVRFGLLSLDVTQKKATLYVGKKQRLLGSIVKLEAPLGMLKFNSETQIVELEDIIKYKIIFKDRPLPIM